MSRKTRRPALDESGVGIMMALGIGLLLMAMGALALSLFSIGQNSAGRHLGFEQAIHVAENGIDTALAKQQQAQGTFNTDAAWVVNGALPAGTDTVQEEETWLRERADYAVANWSILDPAIKGTSPEGDYILVSPSNRQTVYAVGWVPSIAAPKHVRYIKTEWLFSTWRPDHALLVNGPLKIASAQVLGIAGNVHANSDIELQGGQTEIAGVISTSGTWTGVITPPDPPDIPNAEQGAPQQDVPLLDPGEIWRRQTVVDEYQANWYDLCPDGRARSLYNAAGGIVSSPCTGLTVDDASPGSFRGWSYSGGEWDYNGNGNYDGTYYAYQGNLKISGNPGSSGTPWKASLIAEAAPGPAAGACTTTRLSGDILVTGTPNSIPYMTGLGYIAGRDMKINGNPGPGSASYSGFYAAAEQVEIGGNVSLTGSVVVQDLCDTPTSPINDNYVHGSVQITYDGGLDVLVGATIRSALWLEL